MTTLQQLARDYATAHPTRDGGTWSGWCASLIYRFNDAAKAYPNATAAGDASTIESTDPNAAPIGAFHYWGGVNGNGHVAQDVAGRGRSLFMASSKVTESLGQAIGFISFADYQAKAGLPYRGWARTYGINPARPADDLWQMGDPAPEPAPEPAPAAGYTVVEGDNLWNIAKAHLPAGASNADIAAKSTAIQAANTPKSGDWNLIYPGEVLVIP